MCGTIGVERIFGFLSGRSIDCEKRAVDFAVSVGFRRIGWCLTGLDRLSAPFEQKDRSHPH